MSRFLFILMLLMVLPVYALDSDSDGIDDSADNCPATPNANQLDYDSDLQGDACDDDDDNDGDLDALEKTRLLDNRVLVSYQSGHCLNTVSKIYCWGQVDATPGMFYGFTPSNSFALELDMVNDSGCLLARDRQSIECWGAPDPDMFFSRSPQNAVKIAHERDTVCFLDELGAECYGPGFLTAFYGQVFTNPSILEMSNSIACVADEVKVYCSASSDYQLDLEEKITSLAVVGTGGCAIAGNEIHCWDGAGSEAGVYTPQLLNPRYLRARKSGAAGFDLCAIDDVGIYCWMFDGSDFERTMESEMGGPAYQLTLSGSQKCALLKNKLYCWDSETFTPDTTGQFDFDNDLEWDVFDNCPLISNYLQHDNDLDGTGNACDTDLDGDGVDNDLDNYPYNPDLYSKDDDKDLVDDAVDNCPTISNYQQHDNDLDGIGNACDDDLDGDGVDNDQDNYPYNQNLYTVDADRDIVDDSVDNCLGISNYVQSDSDGDGLGNACDTDVDGDGIDDVSDSHPLNPLYYSDFDRDLINADTDNCPAVSNYVQSDNDGDGVGNACDEDIDGDGVDNGQDSYPLNPLLN